MRYRARNGQSGGKELQIGVSSSSYVVAWERGGTKRHTRGVEIPL
jgi:hypothetical protein